MPQPTLQLVVRVDPAARQKQEDGDTPDAPAMGGDAPPGKVRQVVRWALRREKLLLLA